MNECPKKLSQGSDGHTKTWWECNTCNHTWWIAPWIVTGTFECPLKKEQT